MKKILILILFFSVNCVTAQNYMSIPRKFIKPTSSIPSGFYKKRKTNSCRGMISFIKSKYYGETYESSFSSSIAKVTFYKVTVDYKVRNYAIVCFKKKYSYGCNEYLYAVGGNTEYYYSNNYHLSAGKAFWKYIKPYDDNLNCGARF